MSQVAKHRKKRTKYEIVHDILENCQNGAKKTWVMYRANLSYDLTTNYLNDLAKRGLIENKDGLYYITDKGKQLLELLKVWRQKKSEIVDITKKIEEILPRDEEVENEAQAQAQATTSPPPSN